LSQFSDTSHRSGYEASEWSTDAAELQELGNTLRLLRVEREQEQQGCQKDDGRQSSQLHALHETSWRGGSSGALTSIDINSHNPHAHESGKHQPGVDEENYHPMEDHSGGSNAMSSKNTELQARQATNSTYNNIPNQPQQRQQEVDHGTAGHHRQQHARHPSHEDAVVRQVQHPDGKRERLYTSGRK
jgi:hypothetical protein